MLSESLSKLIRPIYAEIPEGRLPDLVDDVLAEYEDKVENSQLNPKLFAQMVLAKYRQELTASDKFKKLKRACMERSTYSRIRESKTKTFSKSTTSNQDA